MSTEKTVGVNKQASSPFNFSKFFTKSQWKQSLVLLLVILAVFSRISFHCDGDELQKKLTLASAELRSLRQKHENLTNQIKTSFRMTGPPLEQEIVRRQIYFATKELWLFMRYHLGKSMNQSQKPEPTPSIVLKEVAGIKRFLHYYLEKLPAVDGYQKWRYNEASRVSNIIQERLHQLQNPPDCRKAKKLVCESDLCGWGCQQHHLAYCLIYAYATKRTLVLREKHLKHPQTNKVQAILFHKLSKTCTDIQNETVLPWSGASLHANVLSLPILKFLREPVFPRYLPSFIPKDLSKRILRFNADPSSWWVGQMLKYIFKPRRNALKSIHDTLLQIDFKSPMVGIHVRRTDKVYGIEKEAEYHDIDEYMAHVNDYFAQVEQYRDINVRQVYLATDEPNVLIEAVQRYPQYKFYGNMKNVKLASKKLRRSVKSLMGVVVDIHMLALCDFFVCTFSSNIGRMVYELMQTYRLDAHTAVTSVDTNYYFTNIEPHYRVAVMHNTGPRTVAFEIGDTIALHGLRNYCNGTVLRTKYRGSFPWYKTIPIFKEHTFPDYKEVHINAEIPRKPRQSLHTIIIK